VISDILVFAVFACPLLVLAGCCWDGSRKAAAWLLAAAPLPALLLALLGEWNAPVEIPWLPYGPVVRLDAAGAMLLAAASLLWMMAGFAVPAFLRSEGPARSFCVCWLLTLTGSLGVFLVTDLMSFLVFYALVSLPAYGLITYDKTPEARRAGSIYLGFALLGENVLLAAFVLLSGGQGQNSGVFLPLLLLGFGMKMALLPMHFWMPLSYAAAPIPAAAVLSGAGVKAGVIGMLRFLPLETATPSWGEVLVLVGFAGAFFGVAVGLTQKNPKTILAYSSVSQMGFLAAVVGLGLSAGDAGVVPLAAFYAANHVLVKGSLFLAVGAAGARRLVLVPGGLVALGLAGLPLTGGALAKLAVKDPLGYGLASVLASLAAVGTAWLMMHFLFQLSAANRPPEDSVAAGRLLPWLGAAFLCLGFPWVALPLAGLTYSEVLAPAALWKTCWPVGLGVALALGGRTICPRLPQIPPGDILVWGSFVSRAAGRIAASIERADDRLRRWPVAACSVLVVVLLLAWMMRAFA
jgi:formate hydrogenlyase subunit 3/multisubunit Na+/H+ antiporter MnhD subunit